MSSQNKQIDIREYWSVLVRRKILLILPLVIIPLAAFAISFFLSPIYASSVTVLINEPKILPSTVERELEGRPDMMRSSVGDREESFMNLITSTRFLRRLIAVLNLPISEGIRQSVTNIKSSFPEVSENELAEVIMADDLRNHVKVQFESQNLFRLTFSASQPLEAQRRAKALADIFIEENLALELAGVRSNIAFSEEQLALYRDKLKTAEDKLRDFRKQLLVDEATEDTSGINLHQIASAIEVLDNKISNLETRRNDLRGGLVENNIDPALLDLPGDIESDKDRLMGTISKLTDLLTRFSWRDPRVLNLNEEARVLLDEINQKIDNNIDSRFSDKTPQVRHTISDYLNAQIEIDFNRTKKTTLDQSIIEIRNRLSKNPDTEITMQRLQSEIDNYRTLYELFVSRAQYAAINQSAKKVEAEAKYIITKPASLPLSPQSPNKPRLLMIGVILGLALGMAAILIVEILDNSFKKVEDVEKYLGLQVIGTVPRLDLPYDSKFKKKIPVIVGAGVSFILILLIIFLNFKTGKQ